jgi:hypothetical protein
MVMKDGDRPWDDAEAESFMKTLKAETADGKSCAGLAQARRDIGTFVDDISTADRRHAAPGRTTDRGRRPLTVLSPNEPVAHRGCSPTSQPAETIRN